jgi:hypothetical protein
VKIGIAFPIINQYEKAIKAIESVKTRYDWQPFIIPQWRNQKPLAAAWNLGMKRAIEANCAYIIISNDDVLFSPWTIDGMINRLLQEPYDREEVIMATAVNDRGKYADPNTILYIDKPVDPTESDNPDFACFAVHRSFLGKIGEFDENFIPAYFEDNSAHYRIKLLGYKAIATTAAPYYHYGSQSQNHALSQDNPLVNGEAFEKNRAYLMAKWGTCDAHSPGYKYPFNNPELSPKEWRPEWRRLALGSRA